MNSKPLTYDSLKTVLQYMDPNTRLLLSSRAPSIRTAEKAVPLKIDDLQIRNHSIKVNGTEYRYEIYQVDCKDKIPYRVSGECELNGNWVCDVNEFGVRDYIAKYNCVVPGNNRFQNQNLFGDYDDEEIVTHYGRLKKLRSILAMEKQQYEQLKSHQPENDPISREEKQGCFEMFKSIRRNIARVYTNEELEIRHDDEYTGSDLEPLKSEKVVKEAIETAGKRIRQMENELLPFENKINNIRPKFEIHLTKKQGNSLPLVIERVKYTGDLHKAGESLMEFIFGKRLHSVVVNKFEINHKCFIRMPRDLKMRVQDLESDIEEMDDLPSDLE